MYVCMYVCIFMYINFLLYPISFCPQYPASQFS